MTATVEYRHLEAQLNDANERNDGHAIAAIHGKLDAIDAWTVRSRAASLLHGLGFSNDQLDRPVSDFSGGWRMRLNLAQALICRSDLLLLDEPTNHLDLDAVIWLEKWLKSYPGTLILISHDRDFLDPIVDKIIHIEQQTLSSTPVTTVRLKYSVPRVWRSNRRCMKVSRSAWRICKVI
ncbi:glutathione ABC transporter ATP-binding protein [Salmonella bongori]|nr:glutathione ABC transporter ATP-binding protein [Salmonella bongori]